MDILRIFILFSIIGSLVLSVKNWKEFKSNIHWMTPYATIGITLAFILTGIYVTRDLTLNEHIYIIVNNVIEIIRNSFFAIVGLTLFKMGMSLKPLYHWEEGGKFLKEVPTRFLFLVVVGYAMFSAAWFSILVPEIYQNKISSVFPILAMFVIGITTALNEELLFRMFIIGLVIFFFDKWKYKWALGIVLSTIIWSYGHWSFLDLGWIKFFHIFPLGIILGYTLKKYGFETCVFLHIVVNVVNILTAQVL